MMAVSAFKSTTRRRCGLVPNEGSNGPHPSDHLTFHHHKQYHRRSSSFTDLSPHTKYSGDSPRFRDSKTAPYACRAPRFLDRQLSESDMEKRRPIEEIDETPAVRKHADEAFHSLGSLKVIRKDEGMQPMLHRSVRRHEKHPGDHPEGQVEEKIIQAVHAQNKPKRADSLSKDQSELYNIIKAEVLHAVADMKNALENSQEKAWLLDRSMHESTDRLNTSFGEEIMKAFRYICNSYTAKIDQAEEEVKQLKTQLAEQERRCLDLNNFINELIPETGALQSRTESANQDKGIQVFKYVDEQEKRAFLPPKSDRSILDDDTCVSKLSSQDFLSELEKEARQRRESDLRLCPPTECDVGKRKDSFADNKDGLVLPWLEWEEANLQCYSNREIIKQKQECALLDSSSLSHEEKSINLKKLQGLELSSPSIVPHREQLEGTSGGKGDCNTDSESVKFTKGSGKGADSSLLYIKSVELISERIQFRARVECGELLLCIGTLHML